MLIIFCQDISSATDNKLFCNIDKNNVVLCFIFLKENILWIYALLHFCLFLFLLCVSVCHLDNVLLYSIMHITGSVSQNNFG